MLSRIKSGLIKYYKFLGVLTAFLSAVVWILEGKLLKSWESEIEAIDKFKWDLTIIHEFWSIKQQQVQHSIDQGRAYFRLGKIMGGPDGLQKFDEEMGRMLVVNAIKTEAMMAAINISELSKRFEGEFGKQEKLDSLIKLATIKYNEYGKEFNAIEFGVEDPRNITESEIKKIEAAKVVNIRYRDEYKRLSLAIMNEAEQIKESLESKKNRDEALITWMNWIIGLVFGTMWIATIIGSYFEAKEM